MAVFDQLEDRDLSVHATIDWAGVQKRTRGIRDRPSCNEVVLFHIPVDEDVKRDPSRLAEFFNDELESKAEMQVKVWTEGLNRGLVHNLGSANLCLQALH